MVSGQHALFHCSRPSGGPCTLHGAHIAPATLIKISPCTSAQVAELRNLHNFTSCTIAYLLICTNCTNHCTVCHKKCCLLLSRSGGGFCVIGYWSTKHCFPSSTSLSPCCLCAAGLGCPVLHCLTFFAPSYISHFHNFPPALARTKLAPKSCKFLHRCKS